MKFSAIILLAFLAVVISGCDKDKEGSLTIHFRAEYNDEPLLMFDEKTHMSVPVRFSHLSMLVSDIELFKSGAIQSLNVVDLVDLSFTDLTAATDGFTLRFDDIPADTYTGMRFSIGVPADLNAQEPSDFASSHPLSRTGFYWEAWQSYIFMKIEGSIDSPAPGSFDTPFAYHTGSNELLRIFELSVPSIEIEDGKNTDVNLLFDYSDILGGIDILAKPQNHNPEDTTQIRLIVNNLQSGINFFQ